MASETVDLLQNELNDIQQSIFELKKKEEALINDIQKAKQKLVIYNEKKSKSFEETFLNKLEENTPISLKRWDPYEDGTNDLLQEFTMHEALGLMKGQSSDFSCKVVGDEVKSSACEKYMTISCTMNFDSLPKVEYLLTKELVTCEIYPKISLGKTPVKKKEFYSIALFHNISDSTGEENEIKVDFKFLTKDFYKLNNDMKKGTKFTVHHWGGVLPFERRYDACTINSNIDASFFRPKEWPELDSPLPNAFLQNLNDLSLNREQLHVAAHIPYLKEGLYCVTGPPGTGKTLMNAYALRSLLFYFPKKRHMYAAPSNAAVQSGMKQLLSLTSHDMGWHYVFTGSPDKLAENNKKYAISSFGNKIEQMFVEQMLRLKKKETEKQGNAFNSEKSHQKLIANLQRAKTYVENILNAKRTIEVDKEVLTKVQEASKSFRDWEESFKNCSAKKWTLSTIIDSLSNIIDDVKNRRECFEKFLIQRANIVFTTLCGSGKKSIRKSVSSIHVLILDEAAQTDIAGGLIPILHFAPRITVLVGDEKQLPPIVSRHAQDKGYGLSLMGNCIKHLLSDTSRSLLLRENYRMHEEICSWPSAQYYDSKLATSDVVKDREDIAIPIPDDSCYFFKHKNVFVDIAKGSEEKIGQSYRNEKEAREIATTIKHLVASGTHKNHSIGVITFYAAQVDLISKFLGDILSDKEFVFLTNITIATVDGFQGSERDIVIISAVRTREGDAGFLKDSRRINVAMTRAKHRRWVFGHRETLKTSQSDIGQFLSNEAFPPSIVTVA